MANEKRLIYLEDAKEALTGWETDPTDEEIEYTLENLPTVDAVEVVRCKDCTFCKVDNTVYLKDVFGNENDTPRYHCLMGYGYNKPDHFCSYGERREGE